MNSKYPIFVISYNRPQNHITAKRLAEFNVSHFLVLHKEQIEEYKKYFTPEMKKYTTILQFDDDYKLKYETCDNIPHRIKNAGSGAERNFAWDYSIKLGAKAHWLMDDNMYFFYIKGINPKNNTYIRVACNSKEIFQEKFKKGEEFFDKYENLLMIELTEDNFIINKSKYNHRLNTRCFSCNLIYNDMPIRWRGRYNEDVILSFDIMKAGYCIASFYGGILKNKISTREARGGNHAKNKNDKESIYDDGENYKYSSVDKTNLLLNVYPEYFKKVIKYGRVHHEYLKSKINELNKDKKLIKAKIIGEKRISKKDFNKITHYQIPI